MNEKQLDAFVRRALQVNDDAVRAEALAAADAAKDAADKLRGVDEALINRLIAWTESERLPSQYRGLWASTRQARDSVREAGPSEWVVIVCSAHDEPRPLLAFQNETFDSDEVDDVQPGCWPLRDGLASGVTTDCASLSLNGEASRYQHLGRGRVDWVCTHHAPRNRRPVPFSSAAAEAYLVAALAHHGGVVYSLQDVRSFRQRAARRTSS